MIIHIHQTTANIFQKFELFYNRAFQYYGQLGTASKYQKIEMFNEQQNQCFTADYTPSHWTNYIPLRYLFGSPNLTRGCDCKCNDVDIGFFLLSQHGYAKSFYVITHRETDSVLHVYKIAKGSFEYLCIYSGDVQIGLVECSLNRKNKCNNYKVYLLDAYQSYADLLSLFVLYYDNWNHTERFSVYIGHEYVKSFTLAGYKEKYNPNWREAHFPGEHYDEEYLP